MNDSEPNQRIIDLEIRLTHQQRLIDQLNEVVTEHTLQLFKAQKQLAELLQRNDQLQSQLRDQLPNLPHEKPPHY